MINDIILLKLGEIVLKGLNRRSFEQKLIGNINRRLSAIGKFKVYCMQSTIYVEPVDETSDMDAAFEALGKVFGIATMSRAAGCEKDAAKIAELAISYLKDDMEAAKSFKVEGKRSDKSFPMTSIELSQYVGGELAEAYPECRVDVHEPELVVHVEIRDLAAYVHAAPTPGAGGMPVGSNGIGVTLLSGGIDSPVSTYMIAKRGVRLIPVHFFSFPYTSEQAKQKVIELAEILTAYCGKMTIEIVPFTHIQEEIRAKCPEDYFTLVMRRFMMRIASRIAEANGAKATYMIAKRGVRLIPVHFFSFPYTSEQAKQKVIELAEILTAYCGKMTIEIVPFTHIQEEIRAKCPEDYFTLVMRRFMMRIASRIAEANGAKAIVTGENLGQVASQTMEAMASTQAVIDLPVLQPLIGMDKEEIVQIARKIGTFETSILPYEDCCTVFTPKHPKTKPKVHEVAEIESVLDIDALVDEAVAGIERVKVG